MFSGRVNYRSWFFNQSAYSNHNTANENQSRGFKKRLILKKPWKKIQASKNRKKEYWYS